MAVNSIALLRSNLAEYNASIKALHAVEGNGDKTLNLYYSSPRQVYYQGAWLGRVISLLDRFLKWLKVRSSGGSPEETHEEIIHKLFDQVLDQAYEARQRHLVHHIQTIENYFGLKKFEPRANQLKRHADYLSRVFGANHPSIDRWKGRFSQLMKEDCSNPDQVGQIKQVVTKVLQVVKQFWENNLFFKATNPLGSFTQNHPDWAVNDQKLYFSLKEEQGRIDCEGKAGHAVPLVELIKICQPNAKLKRGERDRLNDWITTLNQMSATHLMYLLNEVVEAARIQGHFRLTLGQLINQLDDRGCLVMQRRDREHELLKVKKQIECNGSYYKIGELFSKKGKRKEFSFFTLPEHPDRILMIANNPFRIAIEMDKFERKHCGIPGMDPVEIDRGGKCAIFQKPSIMLKDYTWTSKEMRLTPEDEKIALPLSSFFQCMYEWNMWLDDISYEHLGLVGEKIKTDSWFEQGTDNYLKAEKLCRIASRGNPAIERYLMYVSGYDKHPIFQCYRKEVKKMIETGDFNRLKLKLPMGYSSPHYEKHIENLLEQVDELVGYCVEEVWEAHQLKDDQEELEKKYASEGKFSEEKQELIDDLKLLRKELKEVEDKKAEDWLEDEKNTDAYQLIELAVRNRILEKYLASALPGFIPKTMKGEIVASFDLPEKPTYPEVDVDYYQSRQDFLLKQNKGTPDKSIENCVSKAIL